MVIVAHHANGGTVNSGTAPDIVCARAGLASPNSVAMRLLKIADPPLQRMSRRPMPFSWELDDMIFPPATQFRASELKASTARCNEGLLRCGIPARLTAALGHVWTAPDWQELS